ncbi:hypothetical protein [Microbacterium sp. A1-JK]|uniref:hypothetical protein n=1 Tax=Microbacterium sp. A1-JK TaxID=3177516 RepID=UPI00388B26A0
MNPYIGLGSSLVGLLTIGLFSIQIVVVAAALRYLVRAGKLKPGALLACIAGGAGLLVAVTLMVTNYSVLNGADSPWASVPLLLLPAAFVSGLVVPRVRGERASSELPAEEPVQAPVI